MKELGVHARRLILGVFLLCFLCGTALGQTDTTTLVEPFGLRNQAIPALLFLPFEAAAPETLPKGKLRLRLDTSYSSLFTVDTSSSGHVEFDMELFELRIRADCGFTPRFQMGFQIPYRMYFGGFLDNVIEEYHDLFGFPDAGRKQVDRNRMRLVWVHQDTEIAGYTSAHSGLGDLSVFGKFALLEERGNVPAVSLLAEIRFPSGDSRKMLGAGEFGFGGGLAVAKRFGNLVLNLHAQYCVLDVPELYGDLDINNVFAGSFMAAYRLTKRFAVIGQINLATSLFNGTGVKALDRNIAESIFGFQYAVSSSDKVQVGFAEDPIQGSSPDFSAYVAWSHTF